VRLDKADPTGMTDAALALWLVVFLLVLLAVSFMLLAPG
jgi:hypothetical protein